MSNNHTTDQSNDVAVESGAIENTPNDSSGMYYSTVIKITDPNTGQVLLHTRGE